MKAFFERYIGGFIGAGIGLIAAVLLLTIGFLKTLFILIFMLIGFIVGFKPARQAMVASFKKIFNGRGE